MYYAVVREPGPAWSEGLPLDQQPKWAEHATYMNALADEGFAHLGGPIGDAGRILLIVEAPSGDEVRRRLDGDPWALSGVLEIRTVYRWDILLGTKAPRHICVREPHWYAVLSKQGSAWKPHVAMREQDMWTGHAAYMDGLADDQFVAAGGPLKGDDEIHRALLVIGAQSEEQVRTRLLGDPWTSGGILRIAALDEWNIILGAPCRQ